MPCRAVGRQQDVVIRVCCRELTQIYVHTLCVTIRHDKEKRVSCCGLYSSVCIPIFPDVMTGYARSHSLEAPAIFRLVDSPKTSFILKHHSYTTCGGFGDIFLYFLGARVNFFEASITSSLAFFGCSGRGITFRHPWRSSTM